MANEVYANGREISCKSGDGKVIAAFPDVCFTPPENPATPPGVPVPYPISSFSSDTTEGAKTVNINNKELMIRNLSDYKKCTGDEAGCAAKKGAITSTNESKTYFRSWSMDVKCEGENVVRHLDLTTSNHSGKEAPNAAAPQTNTEGSASSNTDECSTRKADKEEKCRGKLTQHCDQPCRDAQRCHLVAKKNDKSECCEPGNTGHHLVEASAFYDRGRGGAIYRGKGVKRKKIGESVALQGCGNYNAEDAPCVCAEGQSHHTDNHGILHTFQSYMAMQAPIQSRIPLNNGSYVENKRCTTYGQAKKNGIKALMATFSGSGCNEACLLAQFDEFDKKSQLNDQTIVKSVSTGDPYKSAKKLDITSRLAEFIKQNASSGAGGR